MKIKFLGHACFRIEAADGTSIITDPYEPGGYGGAIGYGRITEPADLVLISHEHADHNYARGVPGRPQVLRGGGPQTVKGIEVRWVKAFHDASRGGERGEVSLAVVAVDGVRVCHCGDLGHGLEMREVSALGPVEVLLVPVGGTFTLDAAGATALVERMRPKVVIPMHFKTEKCGFALAGVEEFLRGKERVRRPGGSEVELTKETLPGETEVVVLEPAL
jgi:L-ascorbate metabolism protein UlaG (beta-lactamase superfamily)